MNNTDSRNTVYARVHNLAVEGKKLGEESCRMPVFVALADPCHHDGKIDAAQISHGIGIEPATLRPAYHRRRFG